MWLCTNKSGAGSWYLAICDDDANQLVRIAKVDGASILQLTADGQIKASAGVLHRLIVTGIGVTIGDTVVIKDGGIGGVARVTAVFAAANQTLELEVGANFVTDIFADVTISGGAVYVTGVYT